MFPVPSQASQSINLPLTSIFPRPWHWRQVSSDICHFLHFSMGALGTVHPTPLRAQRKGVRRGVGMISTVGSSTFAELTGRRVTGAHGRDVSAALPRPARPSEVVAIAPAQSIDRRGSLGGSGVFRAHHLCGGHSGPSVWHPASRLWVQRVRGDRLQIARNGAFTRSARRGTLCPASGRPRLLPDSAVYKWRERITPRGMPTRNLSGVPGTLTHEIVLDRQQSTRR
jgi:hypothetical protein